MNKKLIILYVLIFIIGFYLSILFTTNSVINDFYNIVNNNMTKNIPYGELERYQIPSFDDMTYKKTEAKISRVFVFHNFKKGIMYVKYSYIAYDVNGEVITGSTNVYSKWYLEKENGRWIVVDIEEKA